MSTQQAAEHPSNRLSSGAVGRFEEALELVEAQCAAEEEMSRWAPQDAQNVRALQVQMIWATRHARRIYLLEQAEAERRTVDRLRADALAAEAALDDEAARWLGLLATALEQGDYSGLAI